MMSSELSVYIKVHLINFQTISSDCKLTHLIPGARSKEITVPAENPLCSNYSFFFILNGSESLDIIYVVSLLREPLGPSNQ